jgi:hypothetical protein
LTADPDPELRAALRRLHGGHAAAGDLRSRIAAMLQNPPAVDPAGSTGIAGTIGPSRAIVRARRWAIAACVILALGGGTSWYLHELNERHENEEYVEANRGTLKAMVAMHGAPVSASLPASDRIEKLADARAVQGEVSDRLQRRVPCPDLAGSGWKLASAAMVSFRSQPAVRFDFDNAGHRATLISVPGMIFNNPDDDDTYDAMIDGHPISGYVTRGGVHCIVGDADISLDEITALRKKLQAL